MSSLYKKNELYFSLAWIGAYVVLSSLAMDGSKLLGMTAAVEAPLHMGFALAILGWVRKNKLWEKYGLCPFGGKPKDFLYFIPLILIASCNIWNGVTLNDSVMGTVLYIVSMLCVGFIEEVIFRGFLFKSLISRFKTAVAVSSITFGMGHLVNLLNGRDFVSTLLQVCYAIALGFLFTVIFCKGGSLWPCIIVHGIINASSIFAVQPDQPVWKAVSGIVLCVVSVGYTLWILRIRENQKPMGDIDMGVR